jgi:hypothetical protein
VNWFWRNWWILVLGVWLVGFALVWLTGCASDSHRIRADVDMVSTNAILAIWEADKALWCAVTTGTNVVDRLVDARLTLYKGEIEANRLWVKILSVVLPAVGAGAWWIERTLTKRGERRKK